MKCKDNVDFIQNLKKQIEELEQSRNASLVMVQQL